MNKVTVRWRDGEGEEYVEEYNDVYEVQIGTGFEDDYRIMTSEGKLVVRSWNSILIEPEASNSVQLFQKRLADYR